MSETSALPIELHPSGWTFWELHPAPRDLTLVYWVIAVKAQDLRLLGWVFLSGKIPIQDSDHILESETAHLVGKIPHLVFQLRKALGRGKGVDLEGFVALLGHGLPCTPAWIGHSGGNRTPDLSLVRTQLYH